MFSVNSNQMMLVLVTILHVITDRRVWKKGKYYVRRFLRNACVALFFCLLFLPGGGVPPLKVYCSFANCERCKDEFGRVN